MIEFNYIAFDIFRKSKWLSPGRLVHYVLLHFLMHPYKQSGWCHDVFDAIKHIPDDEHFVDRNMSKTIWLN
jgi:hypothetical protein